MPPPPEAGPLRHVRRRLPAGAGPPSAPLERRMPGGRTSMRSARVRRAPAPPRCRRRRSSCHAPRFPRFASACPDFNFEISGDRNHEIYTTHPENVFFKVVIMDDGDEPSRVWAALPGLLGRMCTPSTNPSTPAEKPAVHACPYCAMPSVLSSCWCGFHLYPPALHMRGKGRLLQKRKGTQRFESQLAYAIFTLLHLHSGASATLAPKGSGGLD